MKKEYLNWTIKELINNSNKIEFPEFQREPTIWKLEKKQRLIDSIIRDFDISSIYFYEKNKGVYDCIDGQQRINAIWSFMGINKGDEDNSFHLRISNEIYDDENTYEEIDQTRYLPNEKESPWKKWKHKIEEYKLNIVIISDIKKDDELELNLQFLRLQIGAPLNPGEKLHAMTGTMRDEIFREIAPKYAFFKKINIKNRRYAREQVAAQIVLNAFSKKEDGEFHRSRYVDMQDFFKEKDKPSPADKKNIAEIKASLTKIEAHFSDALPFINNKAIAVSVYLFISDLIDQGKESEIKTFKEFFISFLKTKAWQLPKGLDMDREYRDMLNFQTNVSQAAGEKTAIEKRHEFWRDYFYHYKKHKEIIGDSAYQKRTKNDPNKERAKIILKK
jgi:hypothetical protein